MVSHLSVNRTIHPFIPVKAEQSSFNNPRTAGCLDFPPYTGGGGGALNVLRLTRLLCVLEKLKKKTFESSSKIITKRIGHFLLLPKIGLQGRKITIFSKISPELKILFDFHYLGKYNR